MNAITSQIARHLRDVHFGGNWTVSNLRDNLAGLTWQQAIAKVQSFNTIAALAYHSNYFVCAVSEVLEGKPLTANDKYSFSHPPVNSAQDWESLLNKIWSDAEAAAGLIEQLPDAKLLETFADEKYGTYYRNLHGVIEHMHYHLGQIALVRKMMN